MLRLFVVACVAFGHSAVDPKECHEQCLAAGGDDGSLLQTTLISKVAVDVSGEAYRVIAADDKDQPADEPAEIQKSGAPYPRTPSHAALTLAQMIKEDVAAKTAASHSSWSEWMRQHAPLAARGTKPGEVVAYVPARKPGHLASLMKHISPAQVLLGALAICLFVARRKIANDARHQVDAQNKAATTAPWGVPVCETQEKFYRRAPRAARRTFNEAAPEALAPTPPKACASHPHVRARSSTRDGGRREGPQEPIGAPRAATLDSIGDARAIAGLVFSRASQHEKGLDALRVVRDVLAAAGGEQPLRLEKADLLSRGATPQSFELLRAAGLRDVGRGLVLAEASGPRLLRALAAVESALCAAPSALVPLSPALCAAPSVL